MKKSLNNNKNYSTSRREEALLRAVEGMPIFSPETIRRRTGWKPFQVANCLTALQKKQRIARLKRNAYILTAAIPEQLYRMATAAAPPSYLSFWTACSFYGFTEQQAQAVQVVSTKQYSPFTIGKHPVEMTTLRPERWFGYQQVDNIPLAEPEKLFIECLFQPGKCGGISEVRKCLAAAWPMFNQETFFSYLCRFGAKSVVARCGYLLEELGLKNSYQQRMLKMIPQGYALLAPGKKKVGRYNHRWRLIINDH